MHKIVGKEIREMMGKGEKEAPLKSIKLKVKFQKAKGKAIENRKK